MSTTTTAAGTGARTRAEGPEPQPRTRTRRPREGSGRGEGGVLVYLVAGGSLMPACSNISVLYQKPTTPTENGRA